MSWTTVALATGPAAVTGALGYFSAKLQSRAAIRQAEVTLKHQLAQYDEEHLRHRQGTYHEFLDSTRRLDLMLLSPKPSDNLVEWWHTWQHQVNGVYLYGTDRVRSAAEALTDVFAELANKTDPASEYASIRPKYLEASWSLIDAMREDVAPRKGQISKPRAPRRLVSPGTD